MNTLMIKDLPKEEELDREALATVRGGRARTPQQILAWELTGQPATWQGLVLGEDNQLHLPTL